MRGQERVLTQGKVVLLCFDCLKFLLPLSMSLSVNARMTYVGLNCHCAVQKFFCPFLLKMAKSQFGWTFQKVKKKKNFHQMVSRMTCVMPNDNSAVHTQTQTQTETEGYRMHEVLIGEIIQCPWGQRFKTETMAQVFLSSLSDREHAPKGFALYPPPHAPSRLPRQYHCAQCDV